MESEIGLSPDVESKQLEEDDEMKVERRAVIPPPMPICQGPKKAKRERKLKHCFTDEFVSLPNFVDNEEPCKMERAEAPKLEAKTTS